MHHVREISAGTAAAAPPDDSKIPIGSTGTMHCRKTVPNTTHFRTIAPKVAPKIVPSYSSTTYPPSISDVAKPLVTNTQNYALMKVAGHDGTFSLVALPQVASPMIQTTGIPLQENLKLPIPRYQPARSKKFLNKKTKGASNPKPEMSNVQINQDGPSEATAKLVLKTEKTEPLAVVEESGFESRMFLGSGAEVCEGNKSTISNMEKSINPTFCTGSSVKPRTDIEKTVGSSDGAPLVRCESTKVVDSTNSLTVISPVVFGSPLHLLQSVPKGKLPILPYSKIKKSIALETNATKSNVGQPGQVQISSPPVNVLKVSTLDSPGPPALTSGSSILTKQNYGLGRKRGKRRKPYSEMSGYQTKMRLVGSKLIICKEKCKEKCKAEVETSGKSEVSLKKYRNIMPKPMAETQSLSSLNASNTLLPSNMAEGHLRNRLCGGRLHRWRQGDHSVLTPRNTAKVWYKCHVCDHSFQFKHHLQDHLNGHSNKRPHHCRLCRKSYVHSGSLSTHMRLHHSESRLKKLMCCEFCAKVFGHIRVYFGHLKEVHRVIISTESSCKTPEKKNLTLKVKSEDDVLLHREKSLSNEDDSIPGPTDQIRLQIKCGRCHFIAPTFSDMKLHLFSVHGDKSQEVLPEGVLESKKGVQEEVVKQATHHWRLLNERRHGARGGGHNMGPAGTSRSQQPCTSDNAASESAPPVEGKDNQSQSMKLSEVTFFSRNHYNCLLCAQMLQTQKDAFEHWEKKHNCENPSLLWTIFSSLPKNDHKTT
ncbi:zinc finger protein 438 isoform 2-T2 [Leptodactylus fuscus]|uniref:zinc finger protein 438 isoform X2 n=1 Tax=Leptodactylus fuscus TaxID=238119 RepID=UPI003F4E65FA